MKSVLEILTNVGTSERIEAQFTTRDATNRFRVQTLQDKAITDIDTELITRTTTRRVAVEAPPQAFSYSACRDRWFSP